MAWSPLLTIGESNTKESLEDLDLPLLVMDDDGGVGGCSRKPIRSTLERMMLSYQRFFLSHSLLNVLLVLL